MNVQERIAALYRAIAAYATAYNRLEGLQRDEAERPDKLIPIGYQKTGAVGEFYAMRYLLTKNPGADVVLKPASNHQIDIVVTENGNTKTVKVKTVSRHSKTRTVSPIHGSYDELHLILLDESFKVAYYWITRDVITGQGLRMPDPDHRRKGSKRLTNLTALPEAELMALRGETLLMVRYRAKDVVNSKLKQVRYIYSRRIKRFQGAVPERLGIDSQFGCNVVDTDLGCFITQCRSVLQYILKEANYEPEKRKLYDEFVGKSETFRFFKELRDTEIHAAPGSHQVRSEITITLPMHVRNERELKQWKAKNEPASAKKLEIDYHLQKVVIPDDELYSRLKNQKQNELVRAIEEGRRLYEELELNGETDLFVLCEKYLEEIESFVDFCCEKRIIT